MLTGKIVKWNVARGWGFIARDDGKPDIFVHARQLVDRSRDHLPLETRVRFEITTDAPTGKLRAIDVADLNMDGIHRPGPHAEADALFISRGEHAG